MKAWTQRYALRLVFTDIISVGLTLTAFWFVFISRDASRIVSWPEGPDIPYWAALTAFGLAWLLFLAIVDSRDRHIVGSGTAEYQMVLRGSFAVFAILMAIAFLFRIEVARSLFLFAFPVGVLLLLATRWGWRQWLRYKQKKNAYVYKALVIGEARKVQHIAHTLHTSAGSGYVIIGAATEGGHEPDIGVPVLGRYRDVERIVDELRLDAVILAGADDLSPKVMRRIGWAMADRQVSWIVAPALTDIGGPRIHARPLAGIPLVHVSFPRLVGTRRFLKRTMDIIGSAAIIMLASPLLLGVALAVRLDSPGPIFYQQSRIGRFGKPFPMIKFRSMKVNADDELAELLASQGNSDQPLFKVTDDPRITKVGKFIRKYSLDELPQLFNVFRGEMSLVGPRPQREAEVALYDDAAHRRLMVKPGMSGLWQVSGRSELSWEDALRLDLYYIENWSFTGDLLILFRTFKAVVAPGASAH